MFKFSISSLVNMGVYGLALLLTGVFIPPEVSGQTDMFISWTGTIMTIAILGLDQALIRFFHEPPAGLKAGGLFRVCFYFSSGLILVAGVVCSTLLAAPLYRAIGFSTVGGFVVPALFFNAFFYMVARYFNVLFRMEMNVRVYTVESILMQFFFRLFYIVGFVLPGGSPAAAMVLCSLLGMGGFAAGLIFMRRGAMRPRLAEFTGGAYKTALPYGAAIAPTAVFVTLNGSIPKSYIAGALGANTQGVYSQAYALSNIVSMVQLGFAAFWGAYMFEHYKTDQARIKRVHDYLYLVILLFFAFLVAAEDLIFLIMPMYAAALPIFPIMMLSAVFNILCETTVYGNAIARRPIFDTVGIGLGFGANVLFIVLLVGPFGLAGAAAALAASNLVTYAFRTLSAQKFYRSIESTPRTLLALGLGAATAAVGTVFSGHFWLKLAGCLIIAALLCLLYRKQLRRCIQLGLGMANSIFKGLFSRGK